MMIIKISYKRMCVENNPESTRKQVWEAKGAHICSEEAYASAAKQKP